MDDFTAMTTMLHGMIKRTPGNDNTVNPKDLEIKVLGEHHHQITVNRPHDRLMFEFHQGYLTGISHMIRQ